MTIILNDMSSEIIGELEREVYVIPDEISFGGTLYSVVKTRLVDIYPEFVIVFVKPIHPKGSVSMTDEERERNEREHLEPIPPKWDGS